MFGERSWSGMNKLTISEGARWESSQVSQVCDSWRECLCK